MILINAITCVDRTYYYSGDNFNPMQVFAEAYIVFYLYAWP